MKLSKRKCEGKPVFASFGCLAELLSVCLTSVKCQLIWAFNPSPFHLCVYQHKLVIWGSLATAVTQGIYDCTIVVIQDSPQQCHWQLVLTAPLNVCAHVSNSPSQSHCKQSSLPCVLALSPIIKLTYLYQSARITNPNKSWLIDWVRV